MRLTSPKISSREEGKFLVKINGKKQLSPGGLAQLGERHVRNVEVEGSSPLSSTILSLTACLLTDRPLLFQLSKKTSKTRLNGEFLTAISL